MCNSIFSSSLSSILLVSWNQSFAGFLSPSSLAAPFSRIHVQRTHESPLCSSPPPSTIQSSSVPSSSPVPPGFLVAPLSPLHTSQCHTLALHVLFPFCLPHSGYSATKNLTVIFSWNSSFPLAPPEDHSLQVPLDPSRSMHVLCMLLGLLISPAEDTLLTSTEERLSTLSQSCSTACVHRPNHWYLDSTIAKTLSHPYH